MREKLMDGLRWFLPVMLMQNNSSNVGRKDFF